MKTMIRILWMMTTVLLLSFNEGMSVGGPGVTTLAATSVTGSCAILNGTVNANGTTTTVTFDFGLTTAYGTTLAGIPETVMGNTNTYTVANITGLLPNTIYHFRCNGANTNGTIHGDDLSFITASMSPIVTTLAATGITCSCALLNGTVCTNGAPTTVTFDYGLTEAYGTTVPGTPNPLAGSATPPVNTHITGLNPNTTYHFRCNGTSSNGTTNGADITFTTAAAETAPTLSQWGLILFGLLLFSTGALFIYRNRPAMIRD